MEAVSFIISCSCPLLLWVCLWLLESAFRPPSLTGGAPADKGEGQDLEMREGDDDGVLELAPHYQYISGLRCGYFPTLISKSILGHIIPDTVPCTVPLPACGEGKVTLLAATALVTTEQLSKPPCQSGYCSIASHGIACPL